MERYYWRKYSLPTPVSREDRTEDATQAFDDTKHPIFMSANTRSAQPTVFIPVFPGTNCEYDSARAFERAGAKTIVKVFRNYERSRYRRFCRCI